ncbi:hypothetical protein LZ24_01629 [Desulfobotulus alkaliphilus]|uniref:PIN domain-containing protein n=1 Tax=Desulfobotulus alkaliphilus TaxID=622671 RepID=A0A562RTP4_9BACT|nr:hypothetical protein [Desulfobotulus alkaliphilus]TWI72223.1 hypothetical protein LZ24_01629 [Desulfobotulus alkaliphilus]
MRRVIIFDTSILCVWLAIPGMDVCGSAENRWDKKRVAKRIEAGFKEKALFVLPLATLIETGNHIAQASHSRKEFADALADLMRKSADSEAPWAAFSQQSDLWLPASLKKLADSWPLLAAQQISFGDATIKDVAELYHRMGFTTEILTGDQSLKAHEPLVPVAVPRRRQGR